MNKRYAGKPAQCGAVHLVSVIVSGPIGSVSVDNLEIGAGFGFATLNLVGGNIESENGVQILPNGRLSGEGQVTSSAQAISNAGVVAAENITVNGHVLSFGEISGNGRLHVNGQLVNQLFAEGNVELSASEGMLNTPTGQFLVGDGESITASGFFNSLTNQGDVNLDGVVNLLDVAPFIDRISTGTYQAEADINQDGIVNLLDVDPFIVLLSGG